MSWSRESGDRVVGWLLLEAMTQGSGWLDENEYYYIDSGLTVTMGCRLEIPMGRIKTININNR
ncbi:hypothetical protein NBRC116584_36450 [Hydrogenophaga sp. 5NK40-0174]